MNSLKFYITILTILLKTVSFSQNQNNIWYFGNKAGISFNTSPPTALNDGVFSHSEGVSSICDINGELLFFTNGIYVWDANKNQMPNGFGLLGNNSSSQIIIVPKPGDCNVYYIFTTPSQSSTSPFAFSEVNMKMNGGYGDVANKNTILTTNVTERVTATLKSNGIDYWVVAQSLSFNFLSYSVTNAGVNSSPIISITDDDIYNLSDVIGCMKISRQGNKLCYASETGAHQTHLFDFDNLTGLVSNNFILSDTANYGVEFSYDGSKLYLSRYTKFKLTQYDLSSGNNIIIKNSAVVLANVISNTIIYGGALQIAPDRKIYIARSNQAFLDIIEKPNLLGTNCIYTGNAINLNNKTSTAGLSNQVQQYNSSYCGGLKATYTHATACKNNDVVISVLANFGIAPYRYSIDGINFQNNNIFIGLPNADYIITVKDANLLERTISLSIPLTNSISLSISQSKKPDCGKNNGMVQLKVMNGTSPFLFSNDGRNFQTDSIFRNLSSSLINFTLKDANNCTYTKNFNLESINNLKINAGRDTGIFINEEIRLFAKDINNSGFISYKWEPNYKLTNPNLQNPIATIDKDIDYFLTATNQFGCTASDTIHIDAYKEIGIFVPSAFTPNNDNKNDILKAIPRGMKQLNYFKIFNRYGQMIFYSNSFSNGWDGKINGINQNSGTYVWIAEGVDIKGNLIFRKGYFSIIN